MLLPPVWREAKKDAQIFSPLRECEKTSYDPVGKISRSERNALRTSFVTLEITDARATERNLEIISSVLIIFKLVTQKTNLLKSKFKHLSI